MQNEIKLLNPVEGIKLRNSFGSTFDLVLPMDPMEQFAPTIAAFEKLAINRYFWFVVDFHKWVHHQAGGDLEELSPFTFQEFVGQNHSRLHEVTHPDDLNKVFAFSQAWIALYEAHGLEFVQRLRMSMYFRMQNRHGEYYWVMVQYPHSIYDMHGKTVFALILVTDMSHILQSGIPVMNIVDVTNQCCQQFYCVDGNVISENKTPLPVISRREKQVLGYMAKGCASKQIAAQLNISVRTVDNHRQNMLRRTNTRSSAELLNLTIRMGII